MVITEASVIITSIKTTIEIVKGLKSSHDAKTITQAQSQILEHLFALQVAALALQEKHSALIHEKQALIKKIEQFEQWRNTESEYELKELKPGIFVYSYKNSQQSVIPMHWLCPHCWNDRKKSILQSGFHDESVYNCNRCNFVFHL